MAIYSFNPFGYEGSLVTVECDIRKGIPSIDIVGLADGAVKESRARMKSAIENSGFDLPTERVLMSLAPVDLKKEGAGFDLPMCLAVLSAKDDYPRSQDAKVLVMGEVELGGDIRPVRAVYPALCKAAEAGIKYAIVPEGVETAVPNGIAVECAGNLREAYDALCRIDEAEVYGNDFEEESKEEKMETKIEFDEIPENNLDSVNGMNGLKYAMAVAAAGGHHLLAWGKAGCGKTLALSHFPELLPHLTVEEAQSVTRIHSIAGLLEPNEGLKRTRPFRIPHQTCSLEGMCGGGVNCRPGEISLAHNGTLFLDEAAEFRSSVLQMLRVPLETGAIQISRAGRTTIYPAKFQLLMATSPCPCGNYGNPDKVCLCSEKSIRNYWHKFSAPLIDRIAIRFDCNAKDDEEEFSLKEIREMVSRAFERQMRRQGKRNQWLNPQEVLEFCKLTDDAKNKLDEATVHYDLSQRTITNILKVALTLADMHDTDEQEKIGMEYITDALKLRGELPEIARYTCE